MGILGDVNNDNQVDIADALLVLLYTLERFSFVAPNQGNIALGDVNEDGQIDIADVLLIMTYIANPLDPTAAGWNRFSHRADYGRDRR